MASDGYLFISDTFFDLFALQHIADRPVNTEHPMHINFLRRQSQTCNQYLNVWNETTLRDNPVTNHFFKSLDKAGFILGAPAPEPDYIQMCHRDSIR